MCTCEEGGGEEGSVYMRWCVCVRGEGGRKGRSYGREGGREGGGEARSMYSPSILALCECPWEEPWEWPWLRLNVIIPTRFTQNPATETT